MSSDAASLEQGWFSVVETEPGVFMIAEPLHAEDVKSFLVVGVDRALLIDTGMGVADIRALVAKLNDRPMTVVNSHAHWDHVGGNRLFADDGVTIWIHEAEAVDLQTGTPNAELREWFTPDHLRGPLPPGFDLDRYVIPPGRATELLRGGETVDLGGRVLEVIHAPGHSPGGVVLFDRAGRVLFGTDVAYPCALYAFGEDADLEAYRRTMATLADLAPGLRTVYPSHCTSPMDPALLPAMRDALDAVAAGRRPDEITAEYARHRFDGFSVLAPLPPDADQGTAG